MGDDEQLYRNQNDYVSKYRTVVEYFDAVKIALTATPALHTTQIFGKPVFEYSYRDAVVDGFLVDHDAPHIIETKLSTEGIVYKPGETVVMYDQFTGEITNSDELDDELGFDVEHFNRQVITPNFNRAVLEEISFNINPEGEGKTLIFAVDDNHADLIVSILKDIYEPTGVPNDAIMKITGSIGGGIDPTQFSEKISGMNATEAKEYITKNARLFEILAENRAYTPRQVVISDHEDEVVAHNRGYGKGKTPQDYLDEFNDFINNNINKIAALNVVCTRPHELTRESLKSLKLELDRNNFTEKMLNTAWRELKNEDIAADIISYIRRSALGTELISREERIKRGVEKLRKKHNFTKMQLDWLTRMEKTLIAEAVIDRDVFDTGAFKSQGGFTRIDKVFAGKLSDYLQELNTYIYDDGRKSA